MNIIRFRGRYFVYDDTICLGSYATYRRARAIYGASEAIQEAA